MAQVYRAAHAGDLAAACVLPHAVAAGGALAAVIGQPEVIRGQRLGGQGGIGKVRVSIDHGVQVPCLDPVGGPCHQGRKLCGGHGAQAGGLHIDGKGQLERFAPESCFEGGQLLLRLPLRDRTGVVIAAHRDAPRRARGIVALEGLVNVGLAALAAQHPQHHAVDFAAVLHRVPVDAPLPAGDIHNFSHSVLLTA